MASSRGNFGKCRVNVCRVLLDLSKFRNKLYIDTQKKKKAAMFLILFIANLHNNKTSYSPSISEQG